MTTSLVAKGRGLRFTYHEEVGLHCRVRPLFIESERGARETRDEHDGRFGGVTCRLRPNVGTIGGSDINSHNRNDEGDESEERGELHGRLSALGVEDRGGLGNRLRKRYHQYPHLKYSHGIRMATAQDVIPPNGFVSPKLGGEAIKIPDHQIRPECDNLIPRPPTGPYAPAGSIQPRYFFSQIRRIKVVMLRMRGARFPASAFRA
jgi:hypothetical protein